MNLRRALAAVLAAAVLPVLAAGPAEAARWSHRDATGDVVTQRSDADGGFSTRPDRSNTAADLVRTRVDHRRTAVLVTVRVRDLASPTDRGGEVVLETDGERRFQASFGLRGDRVRGWVRDLEAPRRSCVLHGSEVDRAAGRLTLRLPARCLGRPAWVRVGFTMSAFVEGPEVTAFSHDSMIGTNAVTRPGRLSPRIPRG